MSKYILISHLSCDDLLQLGVGGGALQETFEGTFPPQCLDAIFKDL